MTDLPDELAALERRLAAHRPAHAPPLLRQAILESARHARLEQRRRDWMLTAAALAAALLLGANVAIGLRTAAPSLAPPQRPVALADVQQLRDLVPELTESEAQRQAVLLRAASRLIALPQPRAAVAPSHF